MAGADERDLTKLAEYQAIGGYEALAKARAMTPEAVIEELIASDAARPRRRRLPDGPEGELSREAATGKPTYLVVNADESEPGTLQGQGSCSATRTG